jgi:hypothetical protein
LAAAKLGLISQKSKLAEAIRYTLSRWEGLTRFIDDGRIELDNNTVVRMRCSPVRTRRRALGHRRLADRNLQVERHRSARVPGRHPRQDRQRSFQRDIDQLLPWAYRKTNLKAGLRTAADDRTLA